MHPLYDDIAGIVLCIQKKHRISNRKSVFLKHTTSDNKLFNPPPPPSQVRTVEAPLLETLTVICDSMQLDELISNITLVLRQDVLIFQKLAIRQKPGFLGYSLLDLCSLMQHDAMINDKSHIGE
jgi:hypothetical protein